MAQMPDTRSQLLQAARQLFSQHGYAGTSMRMLSRSIGMSDGIMYHYFPDGKAEIYETLLRECLQSFHEGVRYDFAQYDELPLEEALELLFQRIDLIFRKNIDLFQILVRDTSARFGGVFRQTVDTLVRSERLLPNFFVLRIQRGELRPLDAECAAFELISFFAMHFLCVVNDLQRSPLTRESARKRIFAHLAANWRAPECPAENQHSQEPALCQDSV